MSSIEQVFGCGSRYRGLDRYGLELEIENCSNIIENGLNVKGWTSVTDGSLRNNGLEFITAPPLKLENVSKAIAALFEAVQPSEESYSDRTSVHVHCNMQGSTIDQLKSLCLLYLVTEKVFFDFVSRERFENVFCVPLMDFAAPFSIFKALQEGQVSRNWQKYTALNLLPLAELGTVEFRHMHGTANIEQINTWVQAIDCLKQATKKKAFEEWLSQVTTLNTTSEYGMFLLELFGKIEGQFLLNTSFEYYKESLYSNVLSAKVWQYYENQSAPKKQADAIYVPEGSGTFARALSARLNEPAPVESTAVPSSRLTMTDADLAREQLLNQLVSRDLTRFRVREQLIAPGAAAFIVSDGISSEGSF